LVLEENAHCQERALLDRIAIEKGQLWIMDRNFCVRSLLFRMAQAGAYFLVRWHRSTLPYRATDRLRRRGRCAAGRIFEQAIEVADGNGDVHPLRRIVLKLDQPTRDGETEIVLITNLPAEVAAEICCQAYAQRWQIEAHYQALTDLLHCEVPTLGWPRAALFAFSMSAVAGNALAVLKGNLRVAHGEEIAAEVSDFALVDEVAEVYLGMMVAVPPAAWPRLVGREAAEISALLNDLAAKVPVHRMFRSRRGPKKPKPKRSRGNRIHHVSNKKLLDQARGIRAPTRRSRRSSRTKHRLKKSSCSQG
jgi:Transposase DDE domain